MIKVTAEEIARRVPPVVHDGEFVVVEMRFMDAGQLAVALDTAQPMLHRPGSALLTDSERDMRAASVGTYEDRISNAWRTPAAIAQAETEAKPVSIEANDAYASYEQRVANAWRQP